MVPRNSTKPSLANSVSTKPGKLALVRGLCFGAKYPELAAVAEVDWFR